MAAKCTVKFRNDGPHGTSAVLWWQGRSLNYHHFPRGHRVTIAEARKVKAQLMRGCNELARDLQKRRRRRNFDGARGFRDGVPAAAAAPAAPAPAAPAVKTVAGARRRRRSR